MRWKGKPIPCVWEKRIIKKFLIFPKCINREWRWLEKVQIEQEYKGYCGWEDSQWFD